MSDKDPTPRTPWIREREPWVPEPTPTGRAILRMWIDEQLRLVAEARQRRHTFRWHDLPGIDRVVPPGSGGGAEEQ